jgi:hypothetical protein
VRKYHTFPRIGLVLHFWYSSSDKISLKLSSGCEPHAFTR